MVRAIPCFCSPLPWGGDFADLFGAPATQADDKAIKEKSTRLMPWATAPAQLLNACGSNHLSDADLPAFWRVLSQGNKAVHYFYEGVDASPERQAVGVSRACGAIQDFAEFVVSQTLLESIVKPELLKKMKDEASALLPHLRTLNGQACRPLAPRSRMTGAGYSSASGRMPKCPSLSRSL